MPLLHLLYRGQRLRRPAGTFLARARSYPALPLGAEQLTDPEFLGPLTQDASGAPGYPGWQSVYVNRWQFTSGQAGFNAAGDNALLQDVELAAGSYVLAVAYDIAFGGVRLTVQQTPRPGALDYAQHTIQAGTGEYHLAFTLSTATAVRINLKAGDTTVAALTSASLRPV